VVVGRVTGKGGTESGTSSGGICHWGYRHVREQTVFYLPRHKGHKAWSNKGSKGGKTWTLSQSSFYFSAVGGGQKKEKKAKVHQRRNRTNGKKPFQIGPGGDGGWKEKRKLEQGGSKLAPICVIREWFSTFSKKKPKGGESWLLCRIGVKKKKKGNQH